MKTIGISNKLLNTIYGAAGAQIIALLVVLASTGHFDRVQGAQTLGLIVTAVLGLVTNKILRPLIVLGGAQLVALLVVLVATGQFDRAAWAQLGGVLLTALFSGLFGYRAAPDTVRYVPIAGAKLLQPIDVPAGALGALPPIPDAAYPPGATPLPVNPQAERSNPHMKRLPYGTATPGETAATPDGLPADAASEDAPAPPAPEAGPADPAAPPPAAA